MKGVNIVYSNVSSIRVFNQNFDSEFFNNFKNRLNPQCFLASLVLEIMGNWFRSYYGKLVLQWETGQLIKTPPPDSALLTMLYSQ